ncbi:MAG: helix-turn-helix domain-containing protein [Anaerolineales bacterium]|jgi:excisionase family DNA binding protein
MLKDKGEWMTLSQAAELLGVHASTVRLWSDKGWIPVHRTPGKHRRYLRSEIELWAKASDRSHTMEPENIVQFALRRIRFQIHEGYLENESWYQQLDDEDRRQYRESGRALVQGLTSYLSAQGKDALAEARSVGYEYASRGVRSNLDRIEAVRAFFFFRNALLESMIAIYQEAKVPAGAAWGELLTKVLAFTDQVLITLLETYRILEDKNP